MKGEYNWHLELEVKKTLKEMEDWLRKDGLSCFGIDALKKENKIEEIYKIRRKNQEK